jgi:hypothetical protein
MKYCIPFIASFILLVSCQKTPTAETSREDVLRSGKWMLSQGSVEYKVPYDSLNAYTVWVNPNNDTSRYMLLGYDTIYTHNYNFNGDTIVNIMNIIDATRKDDYFVFGVNNSGLNYLGKSRSSVAQPDSIGFSWYLSNGGNNITFDNALNAFSINNVNATITNFSSTSFTIKYFVPFQYIKYPFGVYAPPVQAYHDTTWVNDTAFYNLTYNKF